MTEDIVDRIDLVLSELHQSRIDLCNTIGITRQAITNWKKNNGLPVVDKALKIAEYLNVSIEWLINGKLNNQRFNSKIIADCINEKLNSLDADEAELKKTLLFKIISPQVLINWEKQRLNPTFNQVYSIAMTLNIPLDNFYLNDLSKKYADYLMIFDKLDEEDQKTLKLLCQRLYIQ